MSKVVAQERAKERELVRRRLERHRRGRWLTRPFTFAMNIKQKKDDVLSGKPRRGGKHWPITDVSRPEVNVRNSGAGASARAACGTCLLECNVGGRMSLVLRALSFASRS